MKKKLIIVIVIIALIGIAVAVGAAFNKKQTGNIQNEPKANESTKAIPKLSAYYESEKVGELNGYTMEMDEESIRDVIIPASPNRVVSMEIAADKNQINNITYEIKNTEDSRLVDSGKIEDWKETGGKIFCNYEVSAIMKPGVEYFFEVDITTDNHEKIYYYARIMVMEKEFVTGQIKFAKDFSSKTFDSEKAAKLALFLEPDLSLANDNMGQVTIKSNYRMLTWGNLQPEKVGATEIVSKEFCIKDSGEAGTYTMYYQIKSLNAQKIEEIYNVAETITVWTCAGRQYVLAYDRELNQVWEAAKNNIGNSFIDLGIQNITDIEHVESKNGNYISYAINGDVYVMDIISKKITPVYKLNAKKSDTLYKTRAKAIQVDDNGNADYMIYGYSPSGKHEGKNGISIMKYSAKDNKSVEQVFVPCRVSAAMLEKQLSKLCYVGDGTLYIMLDDTIYYTNLKTKEWGTLASHLSANACVISDDGTTIAYNTSGGEYDEKSITIVNLTNGKKSTIEAGEGQTIAVCGYTGSNLVYGLGDAASPAASYSFFPMNELKIIDSNLNEVKSYKKEGVYISGVEITDTIINIKRWKKGRAIADEQLLDNTESKEAAASSSYYNDDIKQKELALSFTNNLDAQTELTVEKQGEVIFDSRTEVESKFESDRGIRYYVYGYGKLQGIYTDKDQSQKAARDVYGIVLNSKGSRIWIFEENYN